MLQCNCHSQTVTYRHPKLTCLAVCRTDSVKLFEHFGMYLDVHQPHLLIDKHMPSASRVICLMRTSG